MPIHTRCPGCRQVYALADRQEGKKVRCKNCGEIMVVGGGNRGSAEDDAGEDGRREERVRDRSRGGQTRGTDDEEPRRRRDEYDEELPRRRRPRDDDDEVAEELPRGRRRAVADEDEPVRRRRGRRSDDDEPPRRRPRRRRVGLWIGIGAGGAAAVALVLVVVFVIVGMAEFGGSWPVPRNPPGAPPIPMDRAVTLHIAGVVDRATREAIEDKMRDLPDRGAGFSITDVASEGKRMTGIAAPVADPEGLAARIDFGEVRGISGRLINIRAKKADGPPDNADNVTWALHHLQSKSSRRRKQAADELIKTQPDQRRAEVARALEPLLRDPDLFFRKAAIEALSTWGTEENVPTFLQLLSETERGPQGTQARQALLRALGRLKDERAIEPIARCLDDFFDRRAAGEALQHFGPAAEKIVLKYLEHNDWMVRQVVCDTLRVIGTKASLPSLEALARKRDLASRNAQDAIAAIKARN